MKPGNLFCCATNRFALACLIGVGWCGMAQAQVNWITPGSGNWEDGINWSGGAVPGLADDVTINQGGGNLITIGSAISGVNSLTSAEDLLLLQNQNLTLTTGGVTNGSLTLGINSDLTVNSGLFTANGTTVLDGGNVFGNGGSTLDFSVVTSYITDTGTNDSRTFRGTNGSTLDFSGLTSLTGGGFIRTLNVQADTGSSIDLSNLTNHVGGSVRFEADGAGSVIDLNSLGTLNHTDSVASRLFALNGGTINATALTTIQGVGANTVHVLVDGATSNLNIGSVTDVINSRVEFRNGGTLNTAAFTNFLGSDAIVNDGGTLNLTGITSYDANGGSNFSRLWQANDASTLDVSNVTDLMGGTFIRRLDIVANDGSTIDVSGVTNYLGGSTRLISDGTGSSIDFSGVTNFNIDDGQPGGLIVRDGGTIDASGVTTIQSTDAAGAVIQIDGASSVLNAGALTSAINTEVQLTNGGTHDFSGITDFTGSNALVDSGVTLNLTGVTSYDVNGGGNFSREFEANGAGSVLDVSNLVTLTGGSFIRRLDATAIDGGAIDMSGLTAISSGAVRFAADGIGSNIDLTALQTFQDDNLNIESIVQVSNSGQIDFGPGTTDLLNVVLSANSGGLINGGTFELTSTNLMDEQHRSEILGDGGTIAADVINSSGILSADSLTIDGDYTQGENAIYQVTLDSITDFESLSVLGDVSLDGILDVSIDDGFDLSADIEFLILDVGGVQSGSFIGFSQGDIVLSDNGFNLRIDYLGGDGNDVVLSTGAVVPEPGTLGLMLAGLCAVSLRRRRQS